MRTQYQTDYQRIEAAIKYLHQNFKAQPTLENVAQKVHMSAYHFQRLFSDWAGVSPKKFLQYITVEYAKSKLAQNQSTIADVAYHAGLSGTSRLHDLFISIEGMTPGEFKNAGKGLEINYSFAATSFGQVLIANTGKGICYIAFANEMQPGLELLAKKFPGAQLLQASNNLQEEALRFFNGTGGSSRLQLHLRGTAFQLKVWESLLKLPMGMLATYGDIANDIEQPTASRAVGSAIGANPIAFLIPCHRVIRATGVLGDYMWGADRKRALLGWEAAHSSLNKVSNGAEAEEY